MEVSWSLTFAKMQNLYKQYARGNNHRSTIPLTPSPSLGCPWWTCGFIGTCRRTFSRRTCPWLCIHLHIWWEWHHHQKVKLRVHLSFWDLFKDGTEYLCFSYVVVLEVGVLLEKLSMRWCSCHHRHLSKSLIWWRVLLERRWSIGRIITKWLFTWRAYNCFAKRIYRLISASSKI